MLAIVMGSISLSFGFFLMMGIITSSIISESILSIICSILGFIFGVLGFVGGVFLLREKKLGGILAIFIGGAGGFVMGVLIIVFPPSIPSWNFLLPYIIAGFSVLFIIFQGIVVSAGIVGIKSSSNGEVDNSI